MCYGLAFTHPATMIRTSALEIVGRYRDDYPLAQDYELFFRLSSTFNCANIAEALVRKEERPTSVSTARRRLSLQMRIKAQIAHFDAKSPHSYLGLAYSALLYLVPYSLVARLKQFKGTAT